MKASDLKHCTIPREVEAEADSKMVGGRGSWKAHIGPAQGRCLRISREDGRGAQRAHETWAGRLLGSGRRVLVKHLGRNRLRGLVELVEALVSMQPSCRVMYGRGSQSARRQSTRPTTTRGDFRYIPTSPSTPYARRPIQVQTCGFIVASSHVYPYSLLSLAPPPRFQVEQVCRRHAQLFNPSAIQRKGKAIRRDHSAVLVPDCCVRGPPGWIVLLFALYAPEPSCRSAVSTLTANTKLPVAVRLFHIAHRTRWFSLVF